TVGRAGDKARRSVLTAPPAAAALPLLTWLADLHVWGRCEPLPLPLGASHAYAERRQLGEPEPDSLDAAAKAWSHREMDDAYHRIVWGEAYPFRSLLVAPAVSTEQLSSVGRSETSRFAVLARELWSPLLAAEVTE
nr:exodeoxyribonuclease V subunit gamma [Actinomycetota bacterium]